MNEILVAMFAKRDPTTVYYGAGFKFACKDNCFSLLRILITFCFEKKMGGH